MKTIKRSITHARAEDGSVILSTDTPCPQDGLILAAAGWDLSRADKVPVKMFYNHATWSNDDLPIGRWEGLRIENGKLLGTPVFADAEYPKADTIKKLWDAGFLDDVSVSFTVNGKALTGPVQADGRDYMVSTSHTLLECSIVGIGADQNAGKGRILEAVTRGVITEDEAREFDPEVTPTAEPLRHTDEEFTALRNQVATLTKGLETLTSTLDRLTQETARAATPAAPVVGTEGQERNNEPGITRAEIGTIIREERARQRQELVDMIDAAWRRVTGRLPD